MPNRSVWRSVPCAVSLIVTPVVGMQLRQRRCAAPLLVEDSSETRDRRGESNITRSALRS
jgi:hypothetical protein